MVPVPLPCNVLTVFASSTVAVGSKIYFFGGTLCPWNSVLILDTQSGEFRTGPSMKVARAYNPAVGVVDGRIYVIGGRHEYLQVEVFDPKSQTWEFAGEEKVRSRSRFCVSLEGKVYMVDWESGRISSYDPREGISNETTERLSDIMNSVCSIENVMYACFKLSGLMWFNTKLKVWRRLVDRDGKAAMFSFKADHMAEYEGKLAVFWEQSHVDSEEKKNIRCRLIALDRVGKEI